MANERLPLEEMTLRQLRKVASKYNISRYSRMRKAQLLAAIREVAEHPVTLTEPAIIQPVNSHPISPPKEEPEVEASKFQVGQQTPVEATLASVDEGLAELPGGYGESVVVLMPRDPQWCYAYWDIPNDRKEELRRQGGQQLALRIYDVTNVKLETQNPHSVQEYPCDELAREWYIPIPVSDRDYCVEIGYRCIDGRWLILARSSIVRVPPIYPSDWIEDQFATVSWEQELAGKKVLQLSGGGGGEAIEALYERESERISDSLFGSMQQVPEEGMSSYVFPSGVGKWASGAGMSGAGMSGIGMKESGAGMQMSGAGMTSGMGLETMSGAGMTSGMGLETMSGAGMQMSGVGISGMGMQMSGAGISGMGLETMSGVGMTSGMGLETMSGVGMMSGVGLVSGAGMQMSGAGISGMGMQMSGTGISGMGLETMSGVGMMSGMGLETMSGVGMMSGMGMQMSGAGISGMGMQMSGAGISGMGLETVSGVGMMSGMGMQTMSGVGMMSGVGLVSGAGMQMSGAGISGMGMQMSGAGISGMGMQTMSGVGMMSGMGMQTMSGVGMMSGMGMQMSGAGISGMGMQMSGAGISGMGLETMSGVGMMSGMGMQTMSGVGMMSGMGMQTMSGAGISGMGMQMSGAGISGMGMQMSGAGLTMSGMGMQTMSGVGMMSGMGMQMSGAGLTMSGAGLTMSGAGLTMSGAGMGLTMSGVGMSGVGFSASAPPIRPRKFWLVADAELIVYGATEPDATVTIGGKPIKLNPDGTFRFQMSFQDGQLDYPIMAVAADGEQNRSIHMNFNRATPSRNTNTKEEAVLEWFQQ